ncbi:Uncharacterized membrane protein, YraQ family [hydrothermal vent metagenome]|uniref:Uncharacterized membrane protein, YraQ family n=1 Tax=hydrothermal vent metagenome TaxID=652676 RepID=A0A3B0TBS7_9ZZZZ
MTALALQIKSFGRLFGGLDRAWLATVVILLLLALVAPGQAVDAVVFVGRAMAQVAPFIVLSVAIAAYAGASGADNLIARVFSGSPVATIVAAAAFGGLSPFCSCGVIPLIAALLAMGVPLAPVMAFWLASPVIDPAMFALTVGVLDFEFAVAKLLAALWLGLLGGFVTHGLVKAGWLRAPLREGIGGGCGAASLRTPQPVAWTFWREPDRVVKFRRDAVLTTLFLAKWLALAFLLESLMLAYVPAEWVAGALGGGGVWPVVVATFVGVPAYLNGYAALPLVSGLVSQGMSPGAGLAFMVAGGVSSVPAAIAVFALVTRPVFALYAVFALGGSLVAGLAFHAWTI